MAETDVGHSGPGEVKNDDLGGLTLDTAIFPREAILRACYWLAPDASFSLRSDDPGKITVSFTPKDEGAFHDLIARFQAALVDFTIRVEVEAKTATMRNLIWQTAFGEARGAKP